ncbi:hypothetical protein HDV02_003052 [Globomyces sp. JEL0801]|nr:hypothetical protein HDV02_003052 [Globomyces sp. JEL0801]
MVETNNELKNSDVVHLDYQSFRGLKEEKTISFLGIPFAAPPVGILRFKPPVKPLKTTKITNATEFKDACLQKLFGRVYRPEQKFSEDCLYLNVFAPSNARKLPVLVYIYGGSFMNGLGSTQVTDGRNILKKNNSVIIVTFNYRLNIFGFLGGSEIAKEGSGNAGLLDQAAALRWVRQHIEKFGGDNGNVTVMGQSAGAISLGAHLISQNGNQDLFDRAIFLSGSPSLSMKYIQELDKDYSSIGKAFNCSENVLSCLRKVDPLALLQKSANYSFGLSIDGLYIKTNTIEALSTGQFSRIPILVNAMPNEGSIFTYGVGIDTDTAALEQMVKIHPSLTNATVNKYYPSSSNVQPWARYGDFFGDFIFNCGEKLLVDSYAKSGLKVYKSVINHVTVDTSYIKTWWPETNTELASKDLGAYHGSEVPLIWQYHEGIASTEVNQSGKVLTYISQFSQGQPMESEWPVYDLAKKFTFDMASGDPFDAPNLNTKCDFIVKVISDYYQEKSLE